MKKWQHIWLIVLVAGCTTGTQPQTGVNNIETDTVKNQLRSILKPESVYINCFDNLIVEHPYFTDNSGSDTGFFTFIQELSCVLMNKDSAKIWNYFADPFFEIGQYSNYKGSARQYFLNHTLYFNGKCSTVFDYLSKQFQYGFINEKGLHKEHYPIRLLRSYIRVDKGEVFVTMPMNSIAHKRSMESFFVTDNVPVYSEPDLKSRIKSRMNKSSVFVPEIGCMNDYRTDNCMLRIVYNNNIDTGYVDADNVLEWAETQNVFLLIKTESGWKIKAVYQSPGC